MAPKKPDLTLVPEGTDLTDPMEVLDLLKDAILRKSVDKDTVAAALQHVLSKYEEQNRIFLIAAANAELSRIIRLLTFVNSVEKVMMDEDRLENASNKELIKMYSLAQANLLSGLDNIKKVADMRLDAIRAAGGSDGMKSIFNAEDDADLNALAGIPTLNAQQRDRVRKLVSGIVDSVMDDDSVKVEDDESSDDD